MNIFTSTFIDEASLTFINTSKHSGNATLSVHLNKRCIALLAFILARQLVL